MNVAKVSAAVDQISAPAPAANGQYRNMGQTSAVSLVRQNGNLASNSVGLSAMGAGKRVRVSWPTALVIEHAYVATLLWCSSTRICMPTVDPYYTVD